MEYQATLDRDTEKIKAQYKVSPCLPRRKALHAMTNVTTVRALRTRNKSAKIRTFGRNSSFCARNKTGSRRLKGSERRGKSSEMACSRF